jgi:transposase
VQKDVIRYSEGFKLKLVREVELGGKTASYVARKYGIRGKMTVIKWVRRYGAGKLGKVIRVQDVGELDEIIRLKKELSRTKEALADAHIDLSMERAYVELLAEKAGVEDLEAFRKKHDGRQPTRR